MSNDTNIAIDHLKDLLQSGTSSIPREEIERMLKEEKKAQRIHEREMQHLKWMDRKQQRELGKLRKHTETMQSLERGLTAEVKKVIKN